MTGIGERSATDRVIEAAGGSEVLERLAGLPGTDLTTLLLAVTRRRAALLTPAGVLRRYGADRFSAPAALPFDRLRRTEDRLGIEAAATLGPSACPDSDGRRRSPK